MVVSIKRLRPGDMFSSSSSLCPVFIKKKCPSELASYGSNMYTYSLLEKDVCLVVTKQTFSGLDCLVVLVDNSIAYIDWDPTISVCV